MSAMDLFWEIAFWVESVIIIVLCVKLRNKFKKKRSRLPFSVLITLATLLMFLRVITLFI